MAFAHYLAGPLSGPQILLEKSKIIEDLVNQHLTEMVKWASLRVSDKELAKDLVQDTFVAAFQQWEKFEGKSAPKTWLMSILKNKISDHYRKAYARPTFSLEENPHFHKEGNWEERMMPREWAIENEEELLDKPGFLHVMGQCMEKLSQVFQQVMKARYLDGLEAAQICQELGISQTNYWQMIHRSKLQMRKCLEINWFRL
jgi:RNA polymerase sigma-70 factor (ECF subfamily)